MAAQDMTRLEANRLVKGLGTLEREARRIERRRDRQVERLNQQIAEIKATSASEIASLEAQMTPLIELLRQWYRANRDHYGRGAESIKLPSGIIGTRLDSSATVEVTGDEQEVVKAVRRRGLRFVNVRVSLNKRTIAQSPQTFAKVPGLRIKRNVRFFVNPVAVRDAKTAPDRLRVIVPDADSDT